MRVILNSKWRVDDDAQNIHVTLVSALKTLVAADQSTRFPLKPDTCLPLRQQILAYAYRDSVQSQIASVLVSVGSSLSYMNARCADDVLLRLQDMEYNNIVAISVDRRPQYALPHILADDWTGLIALSARDSFRMTWRWPSGSTYVAVLWYTSTGDRFRTARSDDLY